jgi:class 3 adenylate cyclase
MQKRRTNAARCGLNINWFFNKALTVKFKSFYGDKVGGFNFDQTVGIDGSTIHVARAGVHANNDLIWVGRAPNVAAKLSSIRNGTHNTLITKTVYDRLAPESKISNNVNMWMQLSWEAGKAYGVPTIYGSSWEWTP